MKQTGDQIVQKYIEHLEKENKKIVNERQRLIDSNRAIQARINGEWDNEALLKVGLLTTDTEADIITIIKYYSQ